jgi:hypothetical protein
MCINGGPVPQGDPFNGLGWTTVARCWGADQGLEVGDWQVDRRFQAGGRWYAVAWDETTAEWYVRPVARWAGHR